MKKPRHDDTNWFPTQAELKKLRPIAEVDPELLAAHKKGAIRGRGRPKLARKKAVVSLRLDPDVLAACKAKGKGWQRRINVLLRAAVEQHLL